MKNHVKFATAVLVGVMVIGCGKKDDTTTTTTTTTNTPTGVPTTNNSATDAMKNAATGIQNTASDMATKAKNAATDLTGQTQGATATTSTATSQIQQVVDLMGQKKYDAADTVLKQVEGVKGSLPVTLQQQVTGLRTQLDAARAANGAAGMTLPTLPGGK